MGTINFKNKGKFEILLTRQYSTNGIFNLNKDHVYFNNTQNEFSDYCANATCGDWQNDKIKILTLPSQGRLFYLTNPNTGQSPIYEDVYIGQEILVRSLEDIGHQVLKFNGEGFSDDENTSSYITEFTFERYCGNIPSNIIVHVKLNMIHFVREIGEIEVIEPSSLFFFMRSLGTLRSNNHCFMILSNGCLVDRNGRTGFDIQQGDRVYNNDLSNTIFQGQNKIYRIQSALVSTDDVSYIVRISDLGYITTLSLCYG